MSKTEIYLVRHGLPAYEYDEQGRKLMYCPEAHLSSEGRTHVHALARRLPLLDIIYTSSFVRAKETAEILASNLGVPRIIEDPALKDIYAYNSKGMLLDDVLGGKKIEPHPDDEILEKVYTRVLQRFAEIKRKEKGRKVGIVSHGHPIRFIVWRYVERRKGIPNSMNELVKYYYPNQAEAWVFVWNETDELIKSYMIPREDNPSPGMGKW